MKLLVSITCFVLTLGITASVVAQRKSSSHKSRVKNVYKSISGEERRKWVETEMLNGRYQHDGSGELLYIGTIESVPALLQVLKDNPPATFPAELDPPPPPIGKAMTPPQPPRKLYICTYAHAVAALRKITGQTFVDYDEWLKWWTAHQQEQAVKSRF